jgi:hypothetical protein
MALIDCPDCGKQVSSNAPACPNCGAPIAGTTLPYTDHEVAVMQYTAEMKNGRRTTSKSNKGFGKFALTMAVVLVVLGAIGSLLPDPDSESESASNTATPEAPRPIVDGNLALMIGQCDANQVQFEEAWKGKRVRVHVKVKEIDAGFSGGTLIMRKPGGSRYESLSFFGIPREKLAELSKGDEVTLICDRVYESLGDPAFGDCDLEYR